MQTFIIVLGDLWDFVFDDFFLFKKDKAPVTQQVFALPPTATPRPVDVKEVSKVIHKEVIPVSVSVSGEGTESFVVNEEASVFQRPVFSYDGVIKKLRYASRVQVLGYEGRFARISLGETTGWILKDDITSQKEDVVPELHQSEIYSANHPDTHKIRKIILDEFFTTELFLPLQAIEFVAYRLEQANHKIAWPETRPRLAGSWQNILKGQLGIQIGVLPKTGAVIEFLKADGTGFVGYTKAVHIDETIVLQGVGRLIEGEYREEIVTKSEWQEWRPVWITVS